MPRDEAGQDRPSAHADNVHTFRLREGELNPVPGVRGQFSTMTFDNGLTLHLGEFEVENDCILDVPPRSGEPWVGGSIHILGNSVMRLPDGRCVPRYEQHTVLNRIDMPGTAFLLDGGQTVRHMSAVIPVKALKDMLDEETAGGLAPFLDPQGDVCAVETVPTTGRIRSLATSLFSERSPGPGRRLRLQGIASLVLAEVIDGYSQASSARALDAADWQYLGLEGTIRRIREGLGTPLSVEQLAAEAGMSAHRLNRLFLQETGRNCADYIRGERMTRAQSFLLSGRFTVKEVAASVGFNHVSNFTRAYRERFGETPSRVIRRVRP
ncbi:helix-turn-helix transcriptional regulator [Stappia sp.]|uniref:helix-turn-helix transcriptional regulator n=1 Tax=Stappia sp. TaxID=1870903 RepID=UPI0025E48D90|nr:helix-turn-helix transcriptional regulator [Stappia sp.]